MKKAKKLSFTSVMFSIDTITKVFEAVVGKEKYELEKQEKPKLMAPFWSFGISAFRCNDEEKFLFQPIGSLHMEYLQWRKILWTSV